MTLLARVVERVTGRTLDAVARERIFEPLGMKDTGYDPDPSRCAPTTGGETPGRVHDPLARAYRDATHCSGNAGLFSTVDDLALFCSALLQGRLLGPGTVREMFRPSKATRGLGWDVFDDPGWCPGVGHLGYTGTMIWMDEAAGRYVILLTNRVYPDDTAKVNRLRREVLRWVNPVAPSKLESSRAAGLKP